MFLQLRLFMHGTPFGGEQGVHFRGAGDDHILFGGVFSERVKVFLCRRASAADELFKRLEMMLVVVLARGQDFIHLRELVLMLLRQAEHGDFGLIAAFAICIAGDDVKQNDGHQGKNDQADIDEEERHNRLIACGQVQGVNGFFGDESGDENRNENCIRGCSGRGASFFDFDQQLNDDEKQKIRRDDTEESLRMIGREMEVHDLRQQFKDRVCHHGNHVEQQSHDSQPIDDG